MTNPALTNEQWYDKQWLVLLLCIFVFPVGLYALWKSGKISQGWKITGTIIIALGVMGAADGASEKSGGSKTASAPAAETKAPDPAPEEAKAAPSTTETANESSDKYLFETVDDFKDAFNKHSEANDLGFTIDELKMKKGEVKNSFQCMFTDNLGLVGSIDKSSGRVIEVMMLGSSDGTAKSSADLLLCMGAIVATVDPGLEPGKRADVLRDLGLFDKNEDITNLSKKTVKDGIEYYIESSKMTGFIFGATKK